MKKLLFALIASLFFIVPVSAQETDVSFGLTLRIGDGQVEFSQRHRPYSYEDRWGYRDRTYRPWVRNYGQEYCVYRKLVRDYYGRYRVEYVSVPCRSYRRDHVHTRYCRH